MWDYRSDMETVKHFFSELDRKYDINPNLRRIKAETLMDADVRKAWNRLQTIRLVDTNMDSMDTPDTEKAEGECNSSTPRND